METFPCIMMGHDQKLQSINQYHCIHGSINQSISVDNKTVPGTGIVETLVISVFG